MAGWKEFRRGKRGKLDVAAFEFNLEDNLLELQHALRSQAYQPGPYVRFLVRDPKPRVIHKASVADRVVHQVVFRSLYRRLDPYFIYDSYSCRRRKGTHAGVARLETFIRRASVNYSRSAWTLKCDVRKFFDSIDQNILLTLLKRQIKDQSILKLVELIINSFEHVSGRGLPLGNVTSQLFANVYLNEFDQFVKHELNQHWYLRYCDDFVIVGRDKDELAALVPIMAAFLQDQLKLTLHPNKIILRSARQGMDFLGYIARPHHRVLRTKTKRRIIGRVSRGVSEASWQSYLGVLSHCRSFGILQKLLAVKK